MPSFANADPDAPGWLLGLTPGRSGACVSQWLALRISQQLHGRHGVATDQVWACRQLLLTGYEHLSAKQRAAARADTQEATPGPHRHVDQHPPTGHDPA